ncbi:acetyl-CoA synthetase-like protein [Fistulina hepatica ATCC 64428]|uniref:Acetyl-CoA synthetase-like protein n=1 Tax=Fistulina hepatica ATCC 64428 TaxID=1128425 RepID=A0A0D7A164_9AGAR|nr:acetyl-CoA synthetase-like protein [Fistulina hepatica ATCC 64428]
MAREYHCPTGPLTAVIPDDLTLPQFMLDSTHELRPSSKGIPWFIERQSGRKIFATEVKQKTRALANSLYSEYSVLLLFARNSCNYPVVVWAIHRLGAIVSPANPDYAVNELVHQLRTTGARLIVTHAEGFKIALEAARIVGIPPQRVITMDGPGSGQPHGTVDELIARGGPKDQVFPEIKLKPGEARTKLAFLCCSSGTTGEPKAVAIPHFAPIANVIQSAVHNKVNRLPLEKQRYRAGAVALCVLPLYHIYGLVVNLHFVLFCAMSLVMVPKFKFDEMLEDITKYRITHLHIVPPQAVLLLKHPLTKKYDLSHIRFIMSGAAPLTGEVTQQLAKMLPNADIGQGYGMTETSTVVTVYPISQKTGKPGSAGQLLPGCVARVVKEDGSLADVGEIGELVVKSPSLALCYYKNEQATQETFVNGWVRTGDEVRFDEEGEMYVIIELKGFQVAPAELEGCILGHPDVSDACVVGIPDDFSGEVPLAFVVLAADAAKRVAADASAGDIIKRAIIKHVADNKIGYKHLAGGVEFVAAIPKNPSGKLLRRHLRAKAKEVVQERKAKEAARGTKAKL